MSSEKNYDDIGIKILTASRNELYLSMPFMDTALCSLEFTPGAGVTDSAATDGERLYYSGAYIVERYLRGSAVINRAYLHIIMHCLLRHIGKARGRDPKLWDLACDAAVESILEGLNYPCIVKTVQQDGLRFLNECGAEMKVLTAEGIYRKLLRDRRSEYDIARLQRIFMADDHSLWAGSDGEKQQQQDESWKNIAQKTQTGMETVLAGSATGGEAILEQIRVENTDIADYRAFLRRFAAPREVLKADGDAFDYIWYSYGLEHYGNMPLIEPPETKEEKRIQDLVIAIDTSMSTPGALVRSFLRCTYSILRSTETFTRHLNIHIIQCDEKVRSDVTIGSFEALHAYMDSLSLTGGSSTDFRPVFDHVDKLCAEGAFSDLRGLIYFTDGMGIYPQRRTKYETAFVFLEEPPMEVKLPPWAIRLTIGAEQTERLAIEEEDNSTAIEEMPEL